MKAGGAWKTNDKGPWDMILIVHGFPNDVSALRFEWAWQNPRKSRRLRHVSKKLPRESSLKYCFRVMSEMLRVGPWNRLPLTVQWLDVNYKQDFDVSRLPPLHIPICVGPIQSRRIQKELSVEQNDSVLKFCDICNKIVTQDDKQFLCFNEECGKTYHVVCLGRHFQSLSENNFLIPIEGTCPHCSTSILWGDIFRYASGCYRQT
ncbi:hypothetical protein JTE90_028829 [Oedothorax gibbosus]|uniref:Structure-specific endonuclease subunit SLX1 C-terminal domain-containing protein n=1 Tax=Oedothorax gibbosus TaxID=931172 RepID=A0AAV6VYP7_9ARAC|nr:hypothetical protein JTE90_028829 [Oedothorax gibbosus]